MPLKLRFLLEGPPPASPFQHATGLRALVLRRLQQADPTLSAAIHDSNQPKPYTLSPLWFDRDRPGLSFFELSLMQDSLLEPLIVGCAQSGTDVRLGADHYHLLPPQTSASAAWTDLLTPGREERPEYAFRLVTPTAHHAPGPFRKTLVLPVPELYFGSWMGRWNLYAETKIDPTVPAVVESQVAVRACAGQTQAIHTDRDRVFIGFQGTVTFVLLKPETVPDDVKGLLRALARFATYSGTGVDTMRGMGQTEYVDDRPPTADR